MNFESLGACGSAPYFDGRAEAELSLGIAFLRLYLGEPPEGYSLQIVRHEHELGEYGTIGLCWEHETIDCEGRRYYQLCGRAMFALDHAVEWSDIAEVLWYAAEDDDDEEAEAEPGDTETDSAML